MSLETLTSNIIESMARLLANYLHISLFILCFYNSLSFFSRNLRKYELFARSVVKSTRTESFELNPCRIKVIGVGGGGSNVLNRISESLSYDGAGVEYLVVNTDIQALSKSPITQKLAIGSNFTR